MSCGLPAELGGAVLQLAVVVVDVVRVAGADVEPLFDRLEVRRQRRRVEPAHAVLGAHSASVRSGVRNDEVQFTVVPPPTERPCRIMIDRSSVARLPCSW